MSSSEAHRVVMPHIITENFVAGPVRLIGRVKSYDAGNDRLTIMFNGKDAFVDTQHLDPMPYSCMSQVEIFGNLNWAIEGVHIVPIIEARILNCINEVDLNLYLRIIPILDKHLKTSQQLQKDIAHQNQEDLLNEFSF
jgi:hypothetical protein